MIFTEKKSGMKRKEIIFAVDNNGIEASQSRRGRERNVQLNGGQFSTRNHKFSLSLSLLNWNQFRSDKKKTISTGAKGEVFVDAN